MSIEDLNEQHILLPEKEWGQHRLKTTTAQIPLLLLFLCSVAGCALAYRGNGELWTWSGIILFFISFFGIVILCDRAIIKQRQRTKKERNKLRKDEKISDT